MRGASALQDVLERTDDPSLRAYVVWMPVIPTDVVPPGDSTLALVRDPRASQFWDDRRRVSDRLAAAFAADSTLVPPAPGWSHGAVVWDAVLDYPPGERFGARVPRHAWGGYPVIAVADTLAARLGAR